MCREYGYLRVRLSDAAAISELVFYQTGKDGRTGAPSGGFDDRVMKRMLQKMTIALQKI